MINLSNKKITVGFISMLIISLVFCNIFAVCKVEAKSLHRSEKIPYTMKPGSVIKYINNYEYEIISGGEASKDQKDNDESDDEEKPLLEPEEYPKPETGMIITYAEDGGVNKIKFANKKSEEKWNTLSEQEQKTLNKANSIKNKDNLSTLDLICILLII